MDKTSVLYKRSVSEASGSMPDERLPDFMVNQLGMNTMESERLTRVGVEHL